MDSPFWTQTISEVAKSLRSDSASGLKKEEAERRRALIGENVLPKKGSVVWWKLLLSQFSSMIVWLLIGAALVAFFLGDAVDTWAIGAILLLNALLGFFQEYRAERSLEALQELATPNAKVVREGILQNIPASRVVPGDLLLLEAGDRVPADGRIVDSSYMAVEEASLTGESVPISKESQALEGNLSIGDRKNMVFMGTVVVAGKGHALVTQTGLQTEMGSIASGLLVQTKEETPLQKKLNRLGSRLVYICVVVVGIVFGLGILRGNEWIDMLLMALSLAVAAIPEGLPAAVTISLSIGVQKMAEKRALVRRLSSVETLGSTDVICTDKTGTLTQNQMTVRELWIGNRSVKVGGTGYAPEGSFEGDSPDLQSLLKVGVLCNNANLFQEEGEWKIAGDPTEGALLTLAGKGGIKKEDLEREFPLIEEIPFDSDRKRMSVLRKEGEAKTLFVKGAPDVLLSLSKRWLVDGKEQLLDEAARDKILKANAALAGKAYRVLAVARQTNMTAPLEEDLIFLGLIAMIDPPRPEVKEALKLCKAAGIQTIMATGDHQATALAIAGELGMNGKRAIDGFEMDQLSDEELKEVSLFSRISAEHKLRLVQALKDQGKIVAMTGDGINDAPAVKAADIGVSMGITGSDVTKESSDMVILDDNFATIVRAVKQGRGIYDNIVKFVGYLLAANVAEILVIFIVILLGVTTADGKPFLPLLPVQLLWMNLVTDGFPAISLALDPIAPHAMQRPPRPPSEPILNQRYSFFLFSICALITIGTLTACFIGLRANAETAQTLTFTTLTILELIKVYIIRLPYGMKLFSNKTLVLALLSSFTLQLLVLYIPALHPIFGTSLLGASEWGLIAAIALPFLVLGKVLAKLFYKHA